MGKQIKDLNIIASIESNDKILVDRGGKGYSANLSELLSSTEIKDIDTIRANAAKGATALQSVPSEYVTETELTSELNKKVDVGNAVTKSYVDRQVNAALSGNGIIPSYVTTGCERIAENILRTRNAYSFVMGAISDLHTTGSDSSATGV